MVSPEFGSMEQTAQAGVPNSLRQLREAAGLHIAALAAALKVPVRKLEALEAGRYEELPDMTFARALASSACRQLKVDPSVVLEQIPHATAPSLGDSQDAINAPFKAADAPAMFSLTGWLKRPVVLGVLALLLGALVLLFLPQRFLDMLPVSGSTTATIEAPSDPAPGVPLEPRVTEEITQPGLALSMSVPTELTKTEAGAATAAMAVPSGAGEEKAGDKNDSTQPVSKSLLSLRATDESWIEVVNGSGGLLMQRVLKPGDVVEFSSAPPYAVVLGRADAVQVTVRGKPFDVMPYARNNVARFEVK